MNVVPLALVALLSLGFGAFIYPTHEQLPNSMNPFSNGLLFGNTAPQSVHTTAMDMNMNMNMNMNMPSFGHSVNMVAPSGSMFTQHMSQMPPGAPAVDSANPILYNDVIIRKSNVPSIPGMDMNTADHAYMAQPRQVEPYINLFIPTGRCSAGFFCRAVMTAYRNKQVRRSKGTAMTVMIGYTIYSAKKESATIPPVTRLRIRRTSDQEIAHYASLLTAEMKKEFPGLCEFETATIMKAFRSAMDSMTECTALAGYSCAKYEFVASC